MVARLIPAKIENAFFPQQLDKHQNQTEVSGVNLSKMTARTLRPEPAPPPTAAPAVQDSQDAETRNIFF